MTENITQQPSTVQNCADFVPNANMTRWFTKSVELQTLSISRIADSLGLHRNTFYSWLKIPGFQPWWLGMVKSYFYTVYLQLLSIGLQNSRSDYRYWHDLLEHVSSQINSGSSARAMSQIEIMATAFVKSAGERGIDIGSFDNDKH